MQSRRLLQWLFVQDHCPMCSAKIIEEEPTDEEEDNVVVEEIIDEIIGDDENNEDHDQLWLCQRNMIWFYVE